MIHTKTPDLTSTNRTQENMTWAAAITCGTLLTFSLFLVLPQLGRTEPPAPPTVITLDFVEWQPPVKVKKTKQPTPKPKPKPPKKRPKPKQILKKPVEKPKPEPIPEPKKEPVLTEEPTPPEEEIQKPDVPEIIEPEPIIEESQQLKVDETNEVDVEETLPIPTPIFQLSTMPRMIHKEKPIYPAIMRARGKEGKVKLEVLIDATGKIRSISVIKSGGSAFDEAAKSAISQSSFTPEIGRAHV